MDSGMLWFAAITLGLNAVLLGAVLYFFKSDEGKSPAHDWAELFEEGWVAAKRSWPDLRSGQKKFLFLSSLFGGGCVVAAMGVGISGANWAAEYLGGIRGEAALPFGLSLLEVWGIQVMFIVMVFGYLEFGTRLK